MQGQVNHFFRYLLSTEPEQYSKDRYRNEARRLWRVVDKHLAESGSQYLVGDRCTIADIALSPWAKIIGEMLPRKPRVMLQGCPLIGNKQISPA